MAIILKQVSILYIFLFLGWFFGKRNKEQASRTGILSFLLVNLFLPCKVFRTFSSNFTVDYITENKRVLLISCIILFFLMAFAKVVSRLFSKDDYLRHVYEYTFTTSNYGYTGYALVEGVFGSTAFTDFVLFCFPYATYAHTYGYCILTGRGLSLKRILNPVTFSMLLGMIFGLFEIPIPEVIASVLANSASCMAPLSMLLTGFSLAAFSFKEIFSDIKAYVAVFLRLIVLPIIVFAICKVFSLNELLVSATLFACLPSGLNTIIFPRLIGEDYMTGARLAFLTHLFFLVTAPLWLAILMRY